MHAGKQDDKNVEMRFIYLKKKINKLLIESLKQIKNLNRNPGSFILYEII